jgi:hypothetical protein
MRPRKYDSSCATGRVSGTRERVDVAGRREPCFERRSRAGARFGAYSGGGVKYRERRVW